ncbi:MAG: 4'-phosphopantetheinyl transferase superfamily protein [Candidatus Competibacteraceae bacterium]|nr:4'-phosphopantetheinyl transferase superfamily protein [Candidatus Competibacteraceae bacterium]HRY15054.1 4'-phosphopantetheinyl transferase superfamily protein [Candidatus Competibacteraceae bacterium]
MSLALPAGEIHLWRVATSVPLPSARERFLLDILSPEERARYERFYFARDRLQYLLVHTLLRLTLSCYAPRAPQSWEFVTNPYGKPMLPGDGPCFNLSHAEGLVACVLADDVALGVDVERLNRQGDWATLTRRWLAPEEQDWLVVQPVEERSTAFLRLWTLKEAYAKARGLGLSLPLDEFAVQCATDSEAVLLRRESAADANTNWQLQCWRLKEHGLALAAALPPGAMRRTVVHRDGAPLLGITP